MIVSRIITTIIAITTTLSLFLTSSPPKPYYHSLYTSPSLTNNESISHHLYTLTRRPHLAGTAANAEAASYVLSTLTANNIRSHLAEYAASLTYPDSRSLKLTRPPPETPITFTLQQVVYKDDPYADVADQVEPTFHAYAKSGTVSGPVAYVNYGRVEDFTTLNESGINVTGSIVLARYGEIFRGDKVRNAYEAGAIGALIYSDRKDFGGTLWFPDDKWLPPSGVQVGTVFHGAGDPTTPGWPSSIDGCERLSEDDVEKGGDVPLIPSLPISGADGEEILRSIGGVVAEDEWQGDEDAPVYRVGPGPGIIELSYKAKQVISTIQNVIGIIEGAEEPDRFIILGNHRDAWTFGAVDPNSGTASLLEVQDPENSSQTVYDSWVKTTKYPEIGRLGDGRSDFSAFLHHIGVPATDMGFGDEYPVYHSMYDDFVWMSKFGDPMFQRHVAAASIWGLIALHLADDEILPFNYSSYAYELQKSAEDLQNELSNKSISLTLLFKSVEKMKNAAVRINDEIKETKEKKGWAFLWNNQPWRIRGINHRLMMAERALTDRDGLPGRPWYKHMIYAPAKHNRYGSICFPGIYDAVENAKTLNTKDSWDLVQHEIWRVSRAITQASLVLHDWTIGT